MSARMLTKQIHEVIDRKVRSLATRQQIAVVTRVKPLTLDPVDLNYIIEEDDVTLSQWAQAYHKANKIKKNDNVVLHYVSGEWVLVDIIADEEPTIGGGEGEGSGVESFEGRKGKVVSKAGDYDVSEVTDAASKAELAAKQDAATAATDSELAEEEAAREAADAAETAAREAADAAEKAAREAHEADAVDAHDASAISYGGGTGMSATDVEAAVDELATEKADKTALTTHEADTTNIHGITDTANLATKSFVETADGLLIPKSLVDAKGDLIGATADNTPARVPVGSDGQVLTADSAQALGLKWTTPEAGAVEDIAHDASSQSEAGTGTLEWTHEPGVVNPRGVLILIAQNVTAADQTTKVEYGGVEMEEAPASPEIHTEGAEDGALYAYFLGRGVPAGNQTVKITVSGAATKRAVCHTIKAIGDLRIEDTTILDSAGTTTPEVAMATGTGVRSLIYGVLHTGAGDASIVTPGAGYTDVLEHDFGAQMASWIRRTAVATGGSVGMSWSTTSEEAGIFGVAISLARTEAKNTPALLNSFQSYNSFHGTTVFTEPSYRRTADGRVQLGGLLLRPGAITPVEKPIFVLPEGFRPSRRHILIGMGGFSAAAGRETRIDVLANGEVFCIEGAVSSVDFLSLDSISFYLD